MRAKIIAALLAAVALGGAGATMAGAAAKAGVERKALEQAAAGAHRSAANRARDQYRHPVETLSFFGVKPTDTVVEIWPMGGWYSEILAPYLAAKGKLIGAQPLRAADRYAKFLATDAALYGKVGQASFPGFLGGTPVAPGTADVVLTFRNVHNWRMGSGDPAKADYAEKAFREMFEMLKPGGVLGIVEHRLPETADAAREQSSGYLKTSTVRRLAEAAGFRFAGASEANANPKDTADYPKGVWTLPPSFAEGDTDRARYAAIGESDRMTLKFVKPAK